MQALVKLLSSVSSPLKMQQGRGHKVPFHRNTTSDLSKDFISQWNCHGVMQVHTAIRQSDRVMIQFVFATEEHNAIRLTDFARPGARRAASSGDVEAVTSCQIPRNALAP